MEKQYDAYRLATRFMMRNPSKHMVAMCAIEGHRYSHRPSAYIRENPFLYFNDEALLIKADMYKEARVPVGELQEVRVGEPIAPEGAHRGLRLNDESMWKFYTPKGENEASEIIVTPEKIPQLLDLIREAQAPRAKEIINKQHRTELKTEAKILAFA